MAEIPEPSSTEDATTTGGSAPTSTDGAVNEAPSAAESTTTPAHVSKSEQAQIDREVAEMFDASGTDTDLSDLGIGAGGVAQLPLRYFK